MSPYSSVSALLSYLNHFQKVRGNRHVKWRTTGRTQGHLEATVVQLHEKICKQWWEDLPDRQVSRGSLSPPCPSVRQWLTWPGHRSYQASPFADLKYRYHARPELECYIWYSKCDPALSQPCPNQCTCHKFKASLVGRLCNIFIHALMSISQCVRPKQDLTTYGKLKPINQACFPLCAWKQAHLHIRLANLTLGLTQVSYFSCKETICKDHLARHVHPILALQK